MYLNSPEIDECQMACAGHPTLAKAANFLARYRDLIDSISDGWPYWGYGTKCADDLQKIVSHGRWPVNQFESTCVTAAEVEKACRKVRTFLKRCRQTKDKPEVLDFLQSTA
jgi:hypothetical protein